MTWFSASAIFAFRTRVGHDGPISVHENVYLIEAASVEEARAFAERFAGESLVADESLTLNGKPAYCEFVGIRKVLVVSNPPSADQESDYPVSGCEATYSEFEVPSEEALDELKRGEPVDLRYF